MSLIALSVIFWASSSALLLVVLGDEGILLELLNLFDGVAADGSGQPPSHSSALLRAILVSSLRRSSFSSGKIRRITFAVVGRVQPQIARLNRAARYRGTIFASHGLIWTITRASGAEMFATFLRQGVGVP